MVTGNTITIQNLSSDHQNFSFVSIFTLEQAMEAQKGKWYSCILSLIPALDGYFRMRWAGLVTRMGERRGVHRVLVGKSEGKRPLGRPRCRWENNIKMDHQEVGGGCGDWMELAQDRDRWRALVNKVMNLRFPKMRGIS